MKEEVFLVRDNKSGEIIDILFFKILDQPRFKSYEDVTIDWRLDKYGTLFIGGGRPSATGKMEDKAQASFKYHDLERVEVVAKKGIVYRCKSLESKLDKRFTLLYDKDNNKIITSFIYINQKEFHKLGPNHVIIDCPLTVKTNRQYEVAIANKKRNKEPQARFNNLQPGKDYWVDFDIINPSGRLAFGDRFRLKTEATGCLLDDSEYLQIKTMKLIYDLDSGKLGDTFDHMPIERLRTLKRDILKRLKLDYMGRLSLGAKNWILLADYPYAEVEVKVIKGEPFSVTLIKDKNGNPIQDIDGNPLQVLIGLDTRSQLKIIREHRLPCFLVAYLMHVNGSPMNRDRLVFIMNRTLDHSIDRLDRSIDIFIRILNSNNNERGFLYRLRYSGRSLRPELRFVLVKISERLGQPTAEKMEELSLKDQFQTDDSETSKVYTFRLRWVLRLLRMFRPVDYENLVVQFMTSITPVQFIRGTYLRLERKKKQLDFLSSQRFYSPTQISKNKKLSKLFGIVRDDVQDKTKRLLNRLKDFSIFSAYLAELEKFKSSVMENYRQRRRLYPGRQDYLLLAWILYQMKRESPQRLNYYISLVPFLFAEELRNDDKLVQLYQGILNSVSKGEQIDLTGLNEDQRVAKYRTYREALLRMGCIPEIKERFAHLIERQTLLWTGLNPETIIRVYIPHILREMPKELYQQLKEDYHALPAVRSRWGRESYSKFIKFDFYDWIEKDFRILNKIRANKETNDKSRSKLLYRILQDPIILDQLADYLKREKRILRISGKTRRFARRILVGLERRKVLRMARGLPKSYRKFSWEYPGFIGSERTPKTIKKWQRIMKRNFGLNKYFSMSRNCDCRDWEEITCVLFWQHEVVSQLFAKLKKKNSRSWNANEITYLCDLWQARFVMRRQDVEKVKRLLFGQDYQTYVIWSGIWRAGAIVKRLSRDFERAEENLEEFHSSFIAKVKRLYRIYNNDIQKFKEESAKLIQDLERCEVQFKERLLFKELVKELEHFIEDLLWVIEQIANGNGDSLVCLNSNMKRIPENNYPNPFRLITEGVEFPFGRNNKFYRLAPSLADDALLGRTMPTPVDALWNRTTVANYLRYEPGKRKSDKGDKKIRKKSKSKPDDEYDLAILGELHIKPEEVTRARRVARKDALNGGRKEKEKKKKEKRLTAEKILSKTVFDSELFIGGLTPTEIGSILSSDELDELLSKERTEKERQEFEALYIERIGPLVEIFYNTFFTFLAKETKSYPAWFWKARRKYLHGLILTRHLFQNRLGLKMEERTNTVDRRLHLRNQHMILEEQNVQDWKGLFSKYKLEMLLKDPDKNISLTDLICWAYPWAFTDEQVEKGQDVLSKLDTDTQEIQLRYFVRLLDLKEEEERELIQQIKNAIETKSPIVNEIQTDYKNIMRRFLAEIGTCTELELEAEAQLDIIEWAMDEADKKMDEADKKMDEADKKSEIQKLVRLYNKLEQVLQRLEQNTKQSRGKSEKEKEIRMRIGNLDERCRDLIQQLYGMASSKRKRSGPQYRYFYRSEPWRFGFGDELSPFGFIPHRPDGASNSIMDVGPLERANYTGYGRKSKVKNQISNRSENIFKDFYYSLPNTSPCVIGVVPFRKGDKSLVVGCGVLHALYTVGLTGGLTVGVEIDSRTLACAHLMRALFKYFDSPKDIVRFYFLDWFHPFRYKGWSKREIDMAKESYNPKIHNALERHIKEMKDKFDIDGPMTGDEFIYHYRRLSKYIPKIYRRIFDTRIRKEKQGVSIKALLGFEGIAGIRGSSEFLPRVLEPQSMFEAIKRNIDKVEYIHADIMKATFDKDMKFEFVDLSNVGEYVDFKKLIKKIVPILRYRGYLTLHFLTKPKWEDFPGHEQVLEIIRKYTKQGYKFFYQGIEDDRKISQELKILEDNGFVIINKGQTLWDTNSRFPIFSGRHLLLQKKYKSNRLERSKTINQSNSRVGPSPVGALLGQTNVAHRPEYSPDLKPKNKKRIEKRVANKIDDLSAKSETKEPKGGLTKEKIIYLLQHPPKEVLDSSNSSHWVNAEGHRSIIYFTIKEFGSWHNGLKAAGLEPIKRGNGRWQEKSNDWPEVNKIIPDLVRKGGKGIIENPRIPTLDEKSSLAAQVQEGDRAAKDALILTNLKSVYESAYQILNLNPGLGLEFQDLVSVGICGNGSKLGGLIRAVELFANNGQKPLPSYIFKAVKNAMIEYVNEEKRQRFVSLDEPIKEGSQKTRLASIEDEKADMGLKELYIDLNELRKLLNSIKINIRKKDRNIEIFILRCIEGRKLKDIAQLFKISLEAVRLAAERIRKNPKVIRYFKGILYGDDLISPMSIFRKSEISAFILFILPCLNLFHTRVWDWAQAGQAMTYHLSALSSWLLALWSVVVGVGVGGLVGVLFLLPVLAITLFKREAAFKSYSWQEGIEKLKSLIKEEFEPVIILVDGRPGVGKTREFTLPILNSHIDLGINPSDIVFIDGDNHRVGWSQLLQDGLISKRFGERNCIAYARYLADYFRIYLKELFKGKQRSVIIYDRVESIFDIDQAMKFQKLLGVPVNLIKIRLEKDSKGDIQIKIKTDFWEKEEGKGFGFLVILPFAFLGLLDTQPWDWGQVGQAMTYHLSALSSWFLALWSGVGGAGGMVQAVIPYLMLGLVAGVLFNKTEFKEYPWDEGIEKIRSLVKKEFEPLILAIDGESGVGKTEFIQDIERGKISLGREPKDLVIIYGDSFFNYYYSACGGSAISPRLKRYKDYILSKTLVKLLKNLGDEDEQVIGDNFYGRFGRYLFYFLNHHWQELFEGRQAKVILYERTVSHIDFELARENGNLNFGPLNLALVKIKRTADRNIFFEIKTDFWGKD